MHQGLQHTSHPKMRIHLNGFVCQRHLPFYSSYQVWNQWWKQQHSFFSYSTWLPLLLLWVWVRDIELLTIQNITDDYSQTCMKILDRIKASNVLIPKCLKSCDTFFITMIFIGGLNHTGGFIPLHRDEHDHINALLYVGSNSVLGGDTVYVHGNEPDIRNHAFSLPFRHGHL